jgi:adhesin transport system membrane fusion protein
MARDIVVVPYGQFDTEDEVWSPDDHEPSGGARIMIWLSIALVVAIGAWASLFEIDQSTRVEGQVIASERIQQIQATQTGIVKRLWVREGERVVAGQMLMSIERDRQQAASTEARTHLASIDLSISRLRAEVAGREPTFDPALAALHPVLLAAQQELHARRRDALEEEIRALGDQLRLADEELRMNSALFRTGDISRTDVLRLERQVLDIRGQMSTRRHRFIQEAQSELARLEAERASQAQVQAERDVTLAHSDLRSPVNGLVNTVRAYTAGAVVREGEEVMQILPTDGELVIEARLRPGDVSMVHPDMPANIKFEAFDYTMYGTLQGRVTDVSPDAITAPTPRGDQTYFRVRIAIDRDQANLRGKRIQLRPGLEASVDIRTGRRTILHYFAKPLTRVFDESLQER